MVQTIQAEKINLYDLETKFKLSLVENDQLFREWRENLPELTEAEKQKLDRVKASYLNLIKRPMLENMVKMVVLSPLLDLAGFFLPPFYTSAEEEIQISAEDEGVIVRGKIDLLVFQDQLWIIVIESNRTRFSLEVGIPQALAYMLASPNSEKPIFGLVSNGSNFIFIKLIQGDNPQYALSDEFSLRRGNDLYRVLGVLRRLGEVIVGKN